MEIMRRFRGGYEETPWRGFEEDFEDVMRRLRGVLPGEVLRRCCGGYEKVTRRLR